MEFIPGIRNAVRAVIWRDGRLLLQYKTGYADGGDRYALPGGSQELGETLEQALSRECMEELGTAVDINGLLHVADFYKIRESIPPTRRHQVEFLFSCGVPGDYVAGNGPRPDKHQADVVWVGPDELATIPLYPTALAAHVQSQREAISSAYLGVLK